jgi:hypothetical protein
MTESSSLYALTDYVFNLLVANKVAMGVQKVFYGDQNLIPASPILCVEADTKNIQPKGMTRTVSNEFRVYVLAYTAFIQSPDANRRAADQLAELVEAILNADSQCGGLVNTSMVAEIASGYAYKTGTIHKTSRILFTASSVTRLPQS